jgi:hypothetical protein
VRRRKPLRLTVIAVVTVAGSLGVLAGSATGAPLSEATPGRHFDNWDNSTTLTGQPADGVGAQAVSPSGCVGRSDNPHRSGHEPRTIVAEARTSCNNPVPELYVRGELVRFTNGAWTSVGLDYGLDFQKLAVSAYPDELYCTGTSYYGLDSYHEVIDVDNQLYVGYTASPTVAITCLE